MISLAQRSSPKLQCFLQSIILFSLGKLIQSQADDCSCTPLVYKWRLNFTKFCVDNDVDVVVGPGSGIDSAFCQIDVPFGSNATDLTPITITSTQIIELDRNLLALKSQSHTGLDLADGSRIEFTSYTAANSNRYSGGLQAELTALNADFQRVRLRWSVRYSNLCEVLPYSFGDSLGWMVYVSDSLPRPETCQTRSDQPSQSPSISFAPTLSPTETPSIQPTLRPSPMPTIQVSSTPSLRPSRIPSRGPSNLPTRMTEPPTDISMSMEYSYDYGQRWEGIYLDTFIEFGKIKSKKEDD